MQLVSPTGATIGSATAIPFGGGVGEPLKILASGSNYLVTWAEGPSKGQTTKGQWFTSAGTAAGTPFTIVAPNAQSTSAVAFLQPGAAVNQFLALVQRYGTGTNPTSDLYGEFLTLSP